MAEQIKLFFNYSNMELKDLEDEVNNFIATVKVIDVQVKHFLEHSLEDDESIMDNFYVIVRYEVE